MVGYEGFWGLCLAFGGILVASLMTCDYAPGVAMC